jgi:hypothetical protein
MRIEKVKTGRELTGFARCRAIKAFSRVDMSDDDSVTRTREVKAVSGLTGFALDPPVTARVIPQLRDDLASMRKGFLTMSIEEAKPVRGLQGFALELPVTARVTPQLRDDLASMRKRFLTMRIEEAKRVRGLPGFTLCNAIAASST